MRIVCIFVNRNLLLLYLVRSSLLVYLMTVLYQVFVFKIERRLITGGALDRKPRYVL